MKDPTEKLDETHDSPSSPQMSPDRTEDELGVFLAQPFFRRIIIALREKLGNILSRKETAGQQQLPSPKEAIELNAEETGDHPLSSPQIRMPEAAASKKRLLDILGEMPDSDNPINKEYELVAYCYDLFKNNICRELSGPIAGVTEDGLDLRRFEYRIASILFQLFQDSRGTASEQVLVLLKRYDASKKSKTPDRETAFNNIHTNAYTLSDLPFAYWADREIVLAAVKNGGLGLLLAPPDFYADKEVVLAAVQRNGMVLRYASDTLKEDIDVVTRAVSQNGASLQFAAENCKANRDVVIRAVSNCGEALYYMDQNFRFDKEIVMLALRAGNNRVFFNNVIPYEFRRDKEVVLAAIEGWEHGPYDDFERCLHPLRFAAQEFISDKDVILTAVLKNGGALKLACDELRDDREIVLAAVGNYFRSLLYASPGLQCDRQIILAALQNAEKFYTGKVEITRLIENILKEFGSDRAIVLLLVQKNALSLKDIPQEFCLDRELIFAGLNNDGEMLQFVHETFVNDREIILAALRNDGMALQYVPDELRKDRDIVLEALRNDGMALQYAPEELRKDRDIVMAAVKSRGMSLEFAAPELRGDQEIAQEAVKRNTMALQFVDSDASGYREVIITAIQHAFDGEDCYCQFVLEYINEKFPDDEEMLHLLETNCCCPDFD